MTDTKTKTTTKTTTVAESLDKKKPTESIDKPVDMDALRAEIRAEIVECQDKLDAENSELDEVVCMIDNVHTSKGKMFKDATKHLPKSEVDILVAQKKVERT